MYRRKVGGKMKALKILMLAGTGIIVYAGLRYFLVPVLPFLIGWCLAVFLLPAVKWIQKKLRIRQDISGAVLIGSFVIGIGWCIWKIGILLFEQIQRFGAQIGLLKEKSELFLQQCSRWLCDCTGIPVEQIESYLILKAGSMQEFLQNKIGEIGPTFVLTFLKGLVVILGGALTAILFGILIIRDVEGFYQRMEKTDFGKNILKIGKKIKHAGGQYLKAQVLLALIVTGICCAGLAILGNSYFLLTGMVIGALDALPFIGSGMILIPWSIVWLFHGEYWLALGYFILYLTADITRQFLEPKIMGQKIGIPPAFMLMSIYIGFFLYGFWGFLLGPVSVILFRCIWEEVWGEKEASGSTSHS